MASFDNSISPMIENETSRLRRKPYRMKYFARQQPPSVLLSSSSAFETLKENDAKGVVTTPKIESVDLNKEEEPKEPEAIIKPKHSYHRHKSIHSLVGMGQVKKKKVFITVPADENDAKDHTESNDNDVRIDCEVDGNDPRVIDQADPGVDDQLQLELTNNINRIMTAKALVNVKENSGKPTTT